MDEFGPNYR
ncbi:hypothetical protein BCIN_15g04290 [Botrytis cinerea B05.10]|uniref:Uncharacterized protein n=1 Tax=Botryotinia fuckeliana (strain B05.10) TaxID=332648 RepID=A0A384K581_BOTFB|nr:hypothetical protein BCIN_15g04290 [Botrytis cinerea B05.10]